jgi:hypothetical protein
MSFGNEHAAGPSAAGVSAATADDAAGFAATRAAFGVFLVGVRGMAEVAVLCSL